MTSVTLPGTGGTVSFKYDTFGRRIYKSSSSGTSIYAYDGDNLVEETNSAGAVVARYSDGLNVDEPLAMLRGYCGAPGAASRAASSTPGGGRTRHITPRTRAGLKSATRHEALTGVRGSRIGVIDFDLEV